MVTRELGKPEKIQIELAQSDHCVLRKRPKSDHLVDKLNMSISRNIFGVYSILDAQMELILFVLY